MFELIGLFFGGTSFGAVLKYISDFMADKREVAKEKEIRKIAEMKELREYNKYILNIESKNPAISWTKRFIVGVIVLTVSFMSFGFFQSEMGVNVPVIETVKETWFFLWESETTKETWVNLKGGVYIKEISTSLIAIVSTYFGASIAKRRQY